jgi:hypothetical protein
LSLIQKFKDYIENRTVVAAAKDVEDQKFRSLRVCELVPTKGAYLILTRRGLIGEKDFNKLARYFTVNKIRCLFAEVDDVDKDMRVVLLGDEITIEVPIPSPE